MTESANHRLYPIFKDKGELLQYAAKEKPVYVITSVFKETSYEDIKSVITKLQDAAVGNKMSLYAVGSAYETLLKDFLAWLNVLCLASYALAKENDWKPGTEKPLMKELEACICNYLNTAEFPKDLLQDTTLVLREIAIIYPLTYLRTELWEVFRAALTNPEHYKTKMEQANLLMNYQFLAGLIEAAYTLNKPAA
jgi:hypothetical protein